MPDTPLGTALYGSRSSRKQRRRPRLEQFSRARKGSLSKLPSSRTASKFALTTTAIWRILLLVSAAAVLLLLLAVIVEVETGLFSEHQRRNIVCNIAIEAIRDAVPSSQPARFRDCTITASRIDVPEPKGAIIIRRVVSINAYDEASGQHIGQHTVTLHDSVVRDVR
jgi:hypothetical protein